jgi:hypothetical protein
VADALAAGEKVHRSFGRPENARVPVRQVAGLTKNQNIQRKHLNGIHI